jgi:hypothetical protein
VAGGFTSGSSGYWDGAGINSSTAAGDGSFLTGIGVADNALLLYTSIGGLGGLVGNEILVKYTYYGDSDLSGAVNGDDYNLIDSGFLGFGSGWLYGDYNYDVLINGDDYNLIDSSFLLQGGPLASGGGGGNGGGPASVPEPTSLTLLMAGAAGLMGMRRRRS